MNAPDAARRQIAETARAVLQGHTPRLEGCRWIAGLALALDDHDRSNEHVRTIVGLASELDEYPAGPVRDRWDASALAAADRELDDHLRATRDVLASALTYLATWDARKWSLPDAFGSFTEHWRPKVVATANGQDVRIVKTQGLFPWHRHESAAEVFLCWRGVFRVELRDRIVELRPGELFAVPPGVEHRTGSDEEAEVIIFEPSEVVNTGDAQASEYTAPRTVLGSSGALDDLPSRR